MAEDLLQVAPDSTGKKLRARSRTIGANTVYEQWTLQGSERVKTAVGFFATPFIPARAVTSQPLLTMLNSSSAANQIAVRRIAVEVDSIVAKTVLSPMLRLYRITAQTGGTAVVPVTTDRSQTLAATGLSVLSDASADRTNSSTALSATLDSGLNAGIVWQQVVPRWQTLVGYQALPSLPLLPDDGGLLDSAPFLLRAGQGLLIRLEAAAALTAADFQFGIKVAFEEYTIP